MRSSICSARARRLCATWIRIRARWFNIDLSSIREKKIQSVCNNLIRYLNKQYDNLIDFRYILVTGGTGAAFFNQLLDYYKGTGLMDDEHMLLTRPMIAGKELPIEFAVVVGAYKGLRGKLGEE